MFFFFNDTATTEIYTLSLHDALPIYEDRQAIGAVVDLGKHGPHTLRPARHHRLRDLGARDLEAADAGGRDRKSTRLNSSHANISYAVFCLKKKKDRLLLKSTHKYCK